MIDPINGISGVWADALWPAIWQGSLLAVVFLLAARWLRFLPPSARHWMWVALAIKLLIMPLWFIRLPAPPPAPVVVRDPSPPPSVQVRSEPGGPKDPDIARWQHDLAMRLVEEGQATSPLRLLSRVELASWCLLIWSIGLAVGVFRLVRQVLELHGLLVGATPLEGEAWRSAIGAASDALGLRAPPRCLVTRRGCSPFVCGLWVPTLVVPADLIGSLEPDAIRRVVLHELAHIRRGDLLWCWIPEVLGLVQWFNPVVHMIAAQARLERELACDQLALTHTDSDPRRYAEVLVDVLSRRTRPVRPRVE